MRAVSCSCLVGTYEVSLAACVFLLLVWYVAGAKQKKNPVLCRRFMSLPCLKIIGGPGDEAPVVRICVQGQCH